MVIAKFTDEANVYEGGLVGVFLVWREKIFETKLRETITKFQVITLPDIFIFFIKQFSTNNW